MTFNFGKIGRGPLLNQINATYGATARLDGTARPLTEDELRRLVPSIFATSAHESRSERFRPIPTIEIIRGLQNEGFSVVGGCQSTTRDPSKRDFTKHLLRLRKLDGKALQVGDTIQETLLRNANDGSSAYDLETGLFRGRCLNSLVALIESISATKVRHSGDVQAKVIEGTFKVLEEGRIALEAPDKWSQIKLDREEVRLLGVAAHQVRFGDAEGNVHTAIRPEQMVIPRRHEDTGNDLWTVFNVAQENAIRGGLTAMGRDANNQPRRSTTRQVKGIDQNLNVNRALWMIADHFAQERGVRIAA
jgi:hypothetical protein